MKDALISLPDAMYADLESAARRRGWSFVELIQDMATEVARQEQVRRSFLQIERVAEATRAEVNTV